VFSSAFDQRQKFFPALHCMKNIDRIFINNILHNFKRVGAAVESDNEVFIIGFILVNRGIISGGGNHKADVFFRYVVGESGLVELYI
jgi:hypothetical protein